MEIFAIAGFALVAVILVALLKQYAPSYAVLALVASTVVLLTFLLRYAAQVLAWARDFSPYIRQTEFACLLKAVGIAVIAQTAQDLCKDSGMTALGAKVELAGRCMVLLAALPLFQQAAETLMVLLQ